MTTNTTLSTKQFTWIPAERLLVAEASDLGAAFDARGDEPLTLKSHHTGDEVVFAIARVERDVEGDLLYWDLAPLYGGARCTVRIYND